MGRLGQRREVLTRSGDLLLGPGPGRSLRVLESNDKPVGGIVALEHPLAEIEGHAVFAGAVSQRPRDPVEEAQYVPLVDLLRCDSARGGKLFEALDLTAPGMECHR